MNLDKCRKMIYSKMNHLYRFIYRGPRNQIEEFQGKIIKCYPSIFIILTTDNIIKSFSYNDFIIKNIKIYSCE